MATVLFDGDCALCNRSVRWLAQRDRTGRFEFVPNHSQRGQQLLRATSMGTQATRSVILIENGRPYTRSTAMIRLAMSLGGLWKLAGLFYVIPRDLRDTLYDWIATNRYRWFGKSDGCALLSS